MQTSIFILSLFLQAEFTLSDKQADAILDINLRRLTLLEVCNSVMLCSILTWSGFLHVLLLSLHWIVFALLYGREINLSVKENP